MIINASRANRIRKATPEVQRNGYHVANSAQVLNDDMAFRSLLMHRCEWFRTMIDWKHDIDKECGYPEEFEPIQYRRLFDREGFANRVVSIIPQECWAMDPELYEDEDEDVTKWEKAVNALIKKLNLWGELERADILSRIAYYGIIVLGVNDGQDLAQPLKGLDAYGNPTGSPGKDMELSYVRCFDESQVRILAYEQNKNNPRFAMPTYYNVRFVDLMTGIPEAVLVAGNYFRRIHWTRIVHLADNRVSGNVFGVPAMRPVLNRLLDLRKLLGGSAEMFWKGAFTGLSFEMDPTIAAEPDFDENRFHEKIEGYQEGLTRHLAVLGGKIKSLAPTVSDPTHHIMAQLNAVAVTIGCPLRLFMGSEEAKMASSTDKRTWNERLHRRNSKYTTPWVIRPFFKRLSHVGVLPEVKDFHTVWPDLNKPTDQDKANLAITRTQAIVQYVAADGAQIIAPRDFLTKILDFPENEAEGIIERSAAFNKGLPMGGEAVTGPKSKMKTANPKKPKGKGGNPQDPTDKSTKASESVEASRMVARGIAKASGGDAI